MWPMRMDMSWDECRQCLRCLELDAYGNMVSVLRAQGPFTEDKKKLLGELAKVLHITNERHRAEVRRAVNDEKLSLIAEKLNGPNTWTDWAIEGRRTIPLLPRLKSHTAFTGLANSLSLVLAAANEKKIPSNESQDSIVKAEASTNCKEPVAEEKLVKSSVSNYQEIGRGRKRKRSVSEVEDIAKNGKQNVKKKLINDGNDVNALSNEENELSSQLLINSQNDMINDLSTDKSRCFDKSLMRNSITCTVSPPIESSNWDDSINSINSITCHDNSVAQSKKITAINVNSNNTTDVELELEERLSYEIDELDAIDPQRNSENNRFQNDNILNDDSNTLTCENTPLSPSEMDRISSPELSQSPSPIPTENISQTLTINSDSTSSSGPGPPQINFPIVSHNNLSVETLNHHDSTDMDATFNSNNIVNINKNNLPKIRLDTKATNIIGVKKGPKFGVKLSHDEMKKVLRKVISNNGDQTINTMSMLKASHVDDVNVENADNMVVLDIRQDVSNETKSLSINNDIAIDIFNSDTKTVLSNIDAHNLVEYSSEDCSSILAHHVEIVHTENNITNDENADSRDISLNENSEIECTSDVPEQLECQEILINSEGHVVIDNETEIYNFETTGKLKIYLAKEKKIYVLILIFISTEESICEIQIEESAVDVGEFNAELATTDIDNFNYVVDDEETVSIPEDERGQYERYNDLSDS
ncbi:hypothetical protein PV327_005402 [Microctonus hyperodae]|uniref:ENT domain-containing protein n=1 Tax=Microctonus hyperodae TaxID=165561 RepID=A0AA39G1A2_MICHY|nr:hypothetical protein PV327_005402 [Microctonus hyperodae]